MVRSILFIINFLVFCMSSSGKAVPRIVLSDKLSSQHDDRCVFGPIPTNLVSGLVW